MPSDCNYCCSCYKQGAQFQISSCQAQVISEQSPSIEPVLFNHKTGGVRQSVVNASVCLSLRVSHWVTVPPWISPLLAGVPAGIEKASENGFRPAG